MPVHIQSDHVKIEAQLDFGSDTSYGAYAITTWYAGRNEFTTQPDCADALKSGILAFFNNDDDGDPVSSFISSRIAPRRIKFKWFDFSELHPVGIPMTTETLGEPSSYPDLPTQLAVCWTWKCEPWGGHKRQSFYSRKYIGPLTTLAVGNGGEVSVACRNSILRGGVAFHNVFDAVGVDAFFPVVYSTKHGDGREPSDAWVDDRFDVQRRRALDPTIQQHALI